MLTIHYPQEKKYSSSGTLLNISWFDSLLINLPATSIWLWSIMHDAGILDFPSRVHDSTLLH